MKILLIATMIFLFILGCQKEYSIEDRPQQTCGSYLIITKDTTYLCNGVTISFLEVLRPSGRTMWLYPGNKPEFDSLKVGDYFKF